MPNLHLGTSPVEQVLVHYATVYGPPSQTRCPVVWEWEKRPGYWRTLKLDEVARLEKAFQDYMEATEKLPVDRELVNEYRSQTLDLQDTDWTVRTSSLSEHVIRVWVGLE